MGPLPRPTPTGTTIAVASVFVAVVGFALGSATLCVVAAGGLLALALAWVDTARVPSLEAERDVQPRRVDRGQTALGMIRVGNPGARATPPCDAIEQLAAEELRIAVPRLAPGRSATLPYQLPTHRRGALEVGPLAIARADPLGLWTARRPLGGTTTLLVQPRVYPIDPRPTGRTHHLEGPISETAPRGTLTFHTLREYVLGDDVRRIHWKTSARTGTLMVREHVDTSQPSTVVVLDTRASRYTDDRFEDAVDVAASVVAASQRRGFPVRFVTSDGDVLLVRSGERGHVLADLLATVQAGPRGDLDRAAVAALGGRDHDAIVFVSGAVDTADLARVTLTSRRFGVRVLVTLRPGETELKWPGGIHFDGPTAATALARWTARAVAS